MSSLCREVTVRTEPLWRAALHDAGFEFVESALSGLPPGKSRRGCPRCRRRRGILCGDLNTPRREFEDGDVLTVAYDTKGRLRPERGERGSAGTSPSVP